MRVRRKSGFTLFELLVVLAIIALLATLIAPRVVGYLNSAKTDVATAQASNIASALELFYIDHGRYPDPQQGLAALVEKPTNGDSAQWSGPYMREASGLVDPWGKPYLYEVEEAGQSFVVRSLGRDGVEGGSGDDQDIAKR